MSEWIKCSDRLPDRSFSARYLTTNVDDGGYVEINYWAGDYFHNWDVTYWMPLPPPPPEDKQ